MNRRGFLRLGSLLPLAAAALSALPAEAAPAPPAFEPHETMHLDAQEFAPIVNAPALDIWAEVRPQLEEAVATGMDRVITEKYTLEDLTPAPIAPELVERFERQQLDTYSRRFHRFPPGYIYPRDSVEPVAFGGPPTPRGEAMVAGALFDFLGYLTTREQAVTLGARHNAVPAVESLKEWAKARSFNLDHADVMNWDGSNAERVPRGWSSGI